jgi:peptidyl-prolyl cis-trans isomerase SurA|tara:strand:+ start:3613 stop:4530 length:918 start_codon:yes stop_codon:yes gene_type:complete
MKSYLLIFFLCLIFNKTLSIETKIIHRIQDEIITTVDIKNEFKYLLALNNSLKKLEKKKILNISNESAVREKIKKIEIKKNFKEIKINDEYLNILLENTYSRLNLKSLEEFELYLKGYDLKLEEVKKKITIDALWNELIIQKYASQITINDNQIKDQISKNSIIQKKEFKLSEIIFEIKNKEDLQKKNNEIIKSIAEIGFENSASIFSISQSAKIGGDIGWISENSLNTKIKENIKYLQIGEISKPIILSTGILLIKMVDIKSSKIDIDLETEFKKAINYERNRQLNQYSKIYYNKIKKNLNFDE